MKYLEKAQKPVVKSVFNERAIIVVAVVVALGLNISPLHAQPVKPQPHFGGGAHFLLGFPQGEFKNNVDRIGYGFSGEFLYSFRPAPVKIGASLGFLINGRETREEPFSTTIPEVTVDVTTTNNILLGHLLLRLQPAMGTIRPYLDGLLGFNYLFTETKIESREQEVAASTNFDDFAFSYGGGGGIMIKVYESAMTIEAEEDIEKKKPSKASLAVLIDARVRYLKGSEAEYLKEGSIRREDTEVTYDVSKSNTDLLTAQIGVICEF